MAATVEEARAGADANREGARALARGCLPVVVFTAGAGTLATEISASRLLAPYFGSSTIVWANIIGLILVYLSLGYWLGGRLADKRPEARLLGFAILAAAGVIAALPFAARPVLDLAVRGLDALSVGAVVGSFFAALALFAVPVTLLGCVSPFAIRLALGHVGEAGSVAGRLYAVSTVGSIIGTFLSAVVTIPLVGTQRTMVGSAALLATGGVLLLGRRWLAVAVAFWLLLLIPAGTIKKESGVIFERDSAYQYVQVVQRADGSRVLRLNEGVVAHSVWRPDTVLTGGYWDLFLLLPPLLGHAVERMLVIGDAGGTIPRAYGALYPQIQIDGVELDPVVTEAGRRYLGLADNPRLRTITADGRPFLASTAERYDIIVVDAYRQPYIPFYLATREFFSLAREHLRPGGLIALNVADVPGDDRLSRAIGSTLLSVFPQAWRWKPLRFNEVMIGLDRPVDRSTLARRAGGAPPAVASLVPLFRAQLAPVRATEAPMTDDRAPVEWLTDRMIIDQIARGGGLDERSLPTAP